MTKKPKLAVLDEKFWIKFSKEYWERKPVTLKGVASPILQLNAAHIFTLLVKYSDHCRKTQTTTGLKLYLSGQPQYAQEILDLLPLKKDGSLAGYHKRITRDHPDYCLVCDELMQVCHEKFDVLGTFMQDLYRQIGIPNKYSELGLYLGNYRKTPFGVHVDGCGVFSIPVAGTKRFRLWTPEYVAKNPDLQDAHQYPEYKKHSTLMTVRPGDIAYWPSSYWHIAESDGSFSSTWSIGTWVDQPHTDQFSAMIKPLLAQKLGSQAATNCIPFEILHRKDGLAELLPEFLNRSIAALRDISSTELHDVALKYWFELASKSGFKHAPPGTVKTRLRSGDTVRGKPAHPILWAPLHKGGLCVAANGMVMETPHTLELIELIHALNSGKKFDLDRAALQHPALQAIYAVHGIEKLN